MSIADTTTYGGFFDLPGADYYTISLTIQRAGSQRPVLLDFKYDHRTWKANGARASCIPATVGAVLHRVSLDLPFNTPKRIAGYDSECVQQNRSQMGQSPIGAWTYVNSADEVLVHSGTTRVMRRLAN
jgi:hypothetical protein